LSWLYLTSRGGQNLGEGFKAAQVEKEKLKDDNLAGYEVLTCAPSELNEDELAACISASNGIGATNVVPEAITRY
jgi:GH24 family phage-related lysozyme (muramidase)